MPTYNYRCGECSHEFECVQRITEDPIRICPSCNAEAASRLITSGNFILRGGGWYADRYSGGSNKKEAKSDASSDAGAGACGAAACATGCAGGSSDAN